MARTATRTRDLQQLANLFLKLPRPLQGLVVVLGVLAVVIYIVGGRQRRDPANDGTSPVAAEVGADGSASYLFCWWNVENLFDDREDKRGPIDKEFDTGFAEDAELRKLKFDHIADALMKMNGGRGPDIIACGEVESVRAVEMLTGVLNGRVKDPEQKYKSFAMKNLNGGRHIATCVISRLNVSQVNTRLHGQMLRIMETHVYANGHDLAILATHWTSQLRQRDGGNGESGRNNYARTIRQAVNKLYEKNPRADVLVCGDFNDTPDAREVTFVLGGIADKAMVAKEPDAHPNDPAMLNLMAGKPADKFGTLWYDGKPLIYDHIVVSPGLLDETGWGCDVDSVKTVTDGLIRPGATRRQPWRFGDPGANMKESERGYSDHFPVVVRLTVKPTADGKKQD